MNLQCLNYGKPNLKHLEKTGFLKGQVFHTLQKEGSMTNSRGNESVDHGKGALLQEERFTLRENIQRAHIA